MVLLIISTVLGSAAFAVGIVLQLSLPSWQFFSGIASFPASRRENIAIPKLRRRLSMLFYGVGTAFLAGALLLTVKTITPEIVYMVYPLVILAAADGVWILYRIYDRNTYSPQFRSAALVSVSLVNIAFFVWYAIIMV